MGGVVQGFVAIAAVIGVGMLLAHVRVLDLDAQAVLARIAFYVASPALMVTVLSEADVGQLFSTNLVASVGAMAVTALVYLVLARLVWHRRTPELVIGVLSAVFVNAANLGIPIATYALGDAALIAPMLLIQMLFVQPAALAVMDLSVAGRRFTPLLWGRAVLTNPLALGALLGLVLGVTGLRLPLLVRDPLELVAGMAVPAMLLAYGVSLRRGPRFGSEGAPLVEITVISLLKLLLQPLVAYSLARFLLGLEDGDLLAITVIAALPTAQNIFIHATRYARGIAVARDSIFITTVASAPVVVAIVAVLA